jgi:hypothetical protein
MSAQLKEVERKGKKRFTPQEKLEILREWDTSAALFRLIRQVRTCSDVRRIF